MKRGLIIVILAEEVAMPSLQHTFPHLSQIKTDIRCFLATRDIRVKIMRIEERKA